MRDELTQVYFQSIMESLNKTAERIALAIERQVVKVLNDNKINDTGDLRKSITHEIQNKVNSVEVVIFSNSIYAQYVHDGTKPNRRMPPIIPIRDWVKRKGLAAKLITRGKNKGSLRSIKTYKSIDEYKAVNQVAWIIAKSIARKGTKGIKFFDIALKQSEGEINKIIAEFKI